MLLAVTVILVIVSFSFSSCFIIGSSICSIISFSTIIFTINIFFTRPHPSFCPCPFLSCSSSPPPSFPSSFSSSSSSTLFLFFFFFQLLNRLLLLVLLLFFIVLLLPLLIRPSSLSFHPASPSSSSITLSPSQIGI